jgi:hypothetical protein
MKEIPANLNGVIILTLKFSILILGYQSKPCREICETYGLCHVFLVGEANAEGVRPSRGVRGHNPPEKSRNG